MLIKEPHCRCMSQPCTDRNSEQTKTEVSKTSKAESKLFNIIVKFS
jgi:hypothetical protein